MPCTHTRLHYASSTSVRHEGGGGGGPLCHPYDPVARPGLVWVNGAAFNFTPVSADADPERLFRGRGVVIAASGNITR